MPDVPDPPRCGPAPTTDPSRPPACLDDEAIDAVIAWYDRTARDLPWRHADASPWGVLVSEIMLQQTPVVRVLPRWQEWMRRWPTPTDLADAPVADVLRAWDRLGYPRRALRLHECARTIRDHHAGEVPATEEELRALPGIGEYTAAAVAAFAFGRRAAVADTNVRRVVVRAETGAVLPAPSYTAGERALVRAALPATDARAARWSQAVMELGALVCTARIARCEICPLAEHGCAHAQAGRPAADIHAARRRTQGFAGTDRQMRGLIMAALRERGPVQGAELAALDPADPPRIERCLSSLVADGLVVRRGALVDLP